MRGGEELDALLLTDGLRDWPARESSLPVAILRRAYEETGSLTIKDGCRGDATGMLLELLDAGALDRLGPPRTLARPAGGTLNLRTSEGC